LISTVVIFHAQNRETINTNCKIAASFKVIMTTSVPDRVSQHNTRLARPRPRPQRSRPRLKTDFLVSDQSCPKTDVLRPHHLSKIVYFASDSLSHCRPDHSTFRSTVLRELNERRQYFVASLCICFL